MFTNVFYQKYFFKYENLHDFLKITQIGKWQFQISLIVLFLNNCHQNCFLSLNLRL